MAIQGMGAIGRVWASPAALLQVGIAILAGPPIMPLVEEHLAAADGPWG